MMNKMTRSARRWRGAAASPAWRGTRADVGQRRSRSACSPTCRALYADIGGAGSVVGGADGGRGFRRHEKPACQIEIVSADHQNKPDIGSAIARRWYRRGRRRCDRRRADLRRRARGLQDVAKEKNKVFLASGAASSDLTGKACSPNTRALDLRHLRAGQRHRRRRWSSRAARPGSSSPPTTPSASALERDTADGGQGQRRQGAGRRRRAAQQRRLLVLPAAGAGVEGQDHRPRQCRRRHRPTRSSRRPSSASSRAARSWPGCWSSSPTSTPRPRDGARA